VAAAAGLVQQHSRRPAVIEDNQIDVAIVVEVSRGGATRHIQRHECRARGGRHIDEPAPAIAAKQLVALPERV
jgi:hypothetical protein